MIRADPAPGLKGSIAGLLSEINRKYSTRRDDEYRGWLQTAYLALQAFQVKKVEMVTDYHDCSGLDQTVRIYCTWLVMKIIK